MPGGDAAESPGRRDRRHVPVMPPIQAALKVPMPDGFLLGHRHFHSASLHGMLVAVRGLAGRVA